MVAIGSRREIRERPGQRSNIPSTGQCSFPRKANSSSNRRPKSWRSKELDRSRNDEVRTIPNLFVGSNTTTKTQSKRLLKQKLQEQPYFKQLVAVNSPEAYLAQRELLKWLDNLVEQESNLHRRIDLNPVKGSETKSISPFEWFNLMIQDSTDSNSEKSITKQLQTLDKQRQEYNRGDFYQSRFKIVLEVLKGLGLVKPSSQIFKQHSWQDRIGMDALVDFPCHDTVYSLPVQIKSSTKAIRTFFRKIIPETLRKKFPELTEFFDITKGKLSSKKQRSKQRFGVQRKNILALNLSSFSISQLINSFNKIITAIQAQAQTELEQAKHKTTISPDELHQKYGQQVSLLPTSQFHSRNESGQKEIIANKFLDPIQYTRG